MQKESNRQKKFSRLVQKELSDLFQRDIRVPGGALMTISVVRTSPDLSICKVYTSVFPQDKREEVFEFLEEENKEIRHRLARRIGKQVRHIPSLKFFLDDTLDYAERIDQLFAEIKKEEE